MIKNNLFKCFVFVFFIVIGLSSVGAGNVTSDDVLVGADETSNNDFKMEHRVLKNYTGNEKFNSEVKTTKKKDNNLKDKVDIKSDKKGHTSTRSVKKEDAGKLSNVCDDGSNNVLASDMSLHDSFEIINDDVDEFFPRIL